MTLAFDMKSYMNRLDISICDSLSSSCRNMLLIKQNSSNILHTALWLRKDRTLTRLGAILRCFGQEVSWDGRLGFRCTYSSLPSSQGFVALKVVLKFKRSEDISMFFWIYLLNPFLLGITCKSFWDSHFCSSTNNFLLQLAYIQSASSFIL